MPVVEVTPLAAALAYAALGWSVLPVEARGKAPLGRLVLAGVHDASRDSATIRRWWQRQPDANVAIACGPSGLVVIDVDPRNGGLESLARIEREHGPFRRALTATSGGRGLHIVFADDGRALPKSLGPGVDVLQGNRYFLAAPSIHPSGGRYAWDLDIVGSAE